MRGTLSHARARNTLLSTIHISKASQGSSKSWHPQLHFNGGKNHQNSLSQHRGNRADKRAPSMLRTNMSCRCKPKPAPSISAPFAHHLQGWLSSPHATRTSFSSTLPGDKGISFPRVSLTCFRSIGSNRGSKKGTVSWVCTADTSSEMAQVT